jgi:hypothetical protein
MAKVKIQGHASGTGILTVTAPNTSTDRTITLPDATGTLLATEGAVTINDAGADVDFRVESDTDTHALFVKGDYGAIGVRADPESDWNTDYAVVQLGPSGSLVSRPAGGQTILGNNAKITGTDFNSSKYIADGEATQYSTNGGSHRFHVVASGSADADITWTNALDIKSDGRGVSHFTARAWARYDQTGTTEIHMHHNCSSITDNAVGNATISFANAIGSTLYCVVVGNAAESDWGEDCNPVATATGSVRIENVSEGGTFRDSSRCHFAVFMSAE